MARMLHDLNQAALLIQIVYWSDRHKNEGGWFPKTYEEWEYELGLSKYQVKNAVTKLSASWHVETKVARSRFHKYAPVIHYRVNVDGLAGAIREYYDAKDLRENEDPLTFESEETLLYKSGETSLSYTYPTTEPTTYKKRTAENSSADRPVEKPVVLPRTPKTYEQVPVGAEASATSARDTHQRLA